MKSQQYGSCNRLSLVSLNIYFSFWSDFVCMCVRVSLTNKDYFLIFVQIFLGILDFGLFALFHFCLLLVFVGLLSLLFNIQSHTHTHAFFQFYYFIGQMPSFALAYSFFLLFCFLLHLLHIDRGVRLTSHEIKFNKT